MPQPAPAPQAEDSLWLVFRDEGLSLHALMYAPIGGPGSGAGGEGARAGAASAGAPVVLQPSEWWWQLRQGARVRLASHTLLHSTCGSLQKCIMCHSSLSTLTQLCV